MPLESIREGQPNYRYTRVKSHQLFHQHQTYNGGSLWGVRQPPRAWLWVIKEVRSRTMSQRLKVKKYSCLLLIKKVT